MGGVSFDGRLCSLLFLPKNSLGAIDHKPREESQARAHAKLQVREGEH